MGAIERIKLRDEWERQTKDRRPTNRDSERIKQIADQRLRSRSEPTKLRNTIIRFRTYSHGETNEQVGKQRLNGYGSAPILPGED